MYRQIGYFLSRVHSEEAMKPQAAEWRRELLEKFQCSLNEFTDDLLEVSRLVSGTVDHRMTFDTIRSQFELAESDCEDERPSTSNALSKKKSTRRKGQTKKGGMKVTDRKSTQRRAMGVSSVRH
uniref:Uncharacterized protein n=1 Tax=Trichuris muris TaxID=70415 RepID=A0A5S6QCH0_TRIMR